jgi:hypothetical protein
MNHHPPHPLMQSILHIESKPRLIPHHRACATANHPPTTFPINGHPEIVREQEDVVVILTSKLGAQ